MKKAVYSLIGICTFVFAVGVASAFTYSKNVVMYLPSWGNIAYETRAEYGATKETNSNSASISTLSYAVALKPRGAICSVSKKVLTGWTTLKKEQIVYPEYTETATVGTKYYSAGRSHNLESTSEVVVVYRFSPDDAR